jgi:hypothetical protein
VKVREVSVLSREYIQRRRQIKGKINEKFKKMRKKKQRKIKKEWLALLIRIRDVPGSDLSPDTDISDRGLS